MIIQILDTYGNSSTDQGPIFVYDAYGKLKRIGGSDGGTGQIGPRGPQGVRGPQGFQGSGSEGTQGRQGAQGVQGVQGRQGAQGTQGRQGAQGAQGVQGIQGTQGTGTQGFQGTQGPAGSGGGGGGGGSSVNYYLNGGTSQGTFDGATYYEFSKTAVIGTGADFSRSSNGLIASFITDVADPSLLLIPAGNWNLEFFFHSSSNGGSPSFYVELYKYDGTTFTSIASNSATPEGITGGTSIDAYFTPLAVPETVLTVNDRLAIRVFVNASSKTITLHTQNGHLCEVITTFTAGLTALNGLQANIQNFTVGTTGTNFAISSNISTHTFNLPDAGLLSRGVITFGAQTIAGAKTFTNNITTNANIIATTAPTTSLGSYNILTRNASTGVFEKLGATNIQPLIYNILIESTVGITTSHLGTNGGYEYSQEGRNVMINNFNTPIVVTATTAPDGFIASYTKLGTASITFASTPIPNAPYGAALNGKPGSTALLTKNGTTVYLLVNNLL